MAVPLGQGRGGFEGGWIAAPAQPELMSLYLSPWPGDAGAELEQCVGWEGSSSPRVDARCRGKGEWC